MPRRLPLLLVLAALPVLGADLWPAHLFLGGGDIWRTRIPLDLTNRAEVPLAGHPLFLTVGRLRGQVPLAGTRAQDVRVADSRGVEMLFDLRADERRLTSGVVPAGAQLIVPCTAALGASQRLYVYTDHPGTYPVPDYLPASHGLVNGGFETAENGVPSGWNLDAGDDQHRVAWVTDEVHGGERSVRVTVAAGAPATWISARQLNIMVAPNHHYRLSGWVAGHDIVGRAGWYTHVATAANPQAVNLVEGNLSGTFGWRKVTLEVTTPRGATTLSFGTVLFGTGTAWFDDAVLEDLDPPTPPLVDVKVGAPEKLALADSPARPEFMRVDGRTWECRCDLAVVNLGPALSNALVSAKAGKVLTLMKRGFNPRSLRVTDAAGRILPCSQNGDTLLFLADVPARTRAVFPLWFSSDAGIGAGPVLSDEDLVTRPGNLAPNPSFELGGAQPDGWAGGTEGAQAEGVNITRIDGGRFGAHCGRAVVPPTAPERWVGWRQAVPCEPSTDYYFAAWIKTENVSGGGPTLYAHYLPAGGKWDGQTGWGAGAALTGTNPWTLRGGVARTAWDTRSFEMHLTFNGRGTVWHDGAVLRKVLSGTLGPVTQRSRATGLAVWTEDPLIKVFRDTPAGRAATGVEVTACRGEDESVQLCVRSATAQRLTVAVDLPNLPAARVERVGYVPVLQPSGYFTAKAEVWERLLPGGSGRTDGWADWWPDYLAPLVGGGLDLAADTTQPLWLTFRIPREATPGVYDGHVRLGDLTLPLSIKVLAPVLPERPTLQVQFEGVPSADDRWLRFCADYKVGTSTIQPEPVFHLENGHVTMDATAWDRAAARRFDELKMSSGYFPGIFYACGWAWPPHDFLGTKFGTPEYKQALQEAVKLLWEHAQAKGWARYLSLYVSDEPHYTRPEVVERLGTVIKYIREAAPGLPVYSSTWGHCKEWDGILNHWGIAQYGQFPLKELAERRAAGDKVWFTTDGQMEIDTPYNACERLLPYYCFAHDVSGWEFWGLCWYTYDPYKYGWHSFIRQADEPGEGKTYNVRYPNGDGYLAYPGAPLGLEQPVATIRLAQCRDGVEDYEVFHALAGLAASKPEAAPRIKAVLDRVRALAFIPNAGGYRATDILPNPDELSRVRLAAALLLDELSR